MLCVLCLGVVPNTVTFTEKRSPCRGRGCTRKRRADESLERDGRADERRVGRLEAVALEGPQIQLVVELILSIELGHEVLDRRRRLRGPVVDAAPHHVDLWSEMMVKLDLWKAPDPERVRNRAAASTHAVHATLPLSEVVANWDELAEALGGSVFEDMLA